MLACYINEKGIVADKKNASDSTEIAFVGVWDTVASFGALNLDRDQEPISEEIKENGRIASNVRKAYHLVAVDDPRLAFRPTLMGFEGRVHEIWFPGVHSDVGSGYREDGLSDLALEFMLARAGQEGIVFKKPAELDYLTLGGPSNQDKAPPDIALQDVEIKPDLKGRLHIDRIRDEKELFASVALGLRNIYVAVDDKKSSQPPVVHHTVIDRIKAIPSYRPPNLLHLKHRVLFEDGSIKTFEGGLDDHLSVASSINFYNGCGADAKGRPLRQSKKLSCTRLVNLW